MHASANQKLPWGNIFKLSSTQNNCTSKHSHNLTLRWKAHYSYRNSDSETEENPIAGNLANPISNYSAILLYTPKRHKN